MILLLALVAAVAEFAASSSAQVSFYTLPTTINAGLPYKIIWQGASSDITITLQRSLSGGMRDIASIASRVSGTDYTWTPPPSLPPAQDYVWQIKAGEADINYSSLFSITGGWGRDSLSDSTRPSTLSPPPAPLYQISRLAPTPTPLPTSSSTAPRQSTGAAELTTSTSSSKTFIPSSTSATTTTSTVTSFTTSFTTSTNQSSAASAQSGTGGSTTTIPSPPTIANSSSSSQATSNGVDYTKLGIGLAVPMGVLLLALLALLFFQMGKRNAGIPGISLQEQNTAYEPKSEVLADRGTLDFPKRIDSLRQPSRAEVHGKGVTYDFGEMDGTLNRYEMPAMSSVQAQREA